MRMLRGVVHGVAAALMLAAVPGAVAGDWPGWLGPTHTGAAPTDEELVDDPAKARLLWVSEDELPGARVADGRKKVPAGGLAQISGGFASPVVAGGRAYLFYTVPNGSDDAYAQGTAKAHEAEGGYGKEKWWIDTDDVVHCFDVATGATLWKRVYARQGMNYNAFNKGGPCNLTPVVADGRVYSVGSAGKVYCIDATSGEAVWESDVGERHRLQEELRKVCHEQKVIPQYNRDMSATAVVVDGVLVTSDFLGYKVQSPLRHFNWSDGCGLVGFDAKTGRRLWHLPKTLGNWNSPTVWKHGDKSYILAGTGGEGIISCVDQVAGKVVWSVTAGEGQDTLMALGAYMVGRADGSLSCWRIDERGATKAWSLPGAYGEPSTLPVLHDGHVYAGVKSGKVVCVELSTGKVKGQVEANVGGFLVLMGDRLFADAELGHDGDRVTMFNADPADFRAMGSVWPAPNATVYMNPLMPACFDGRMVLRITGGRLAAWDLRAAHAHSEPQGVEALAPVQPPAVKPTSAPGAGESPQPRGPVDPFEKPGDGALDDLLE